MKEIPTEPIGSIPRPPELIGGIDDAGTDGSGRSSRLRRGDPRHDRSASRRPARRSSPTASSASTTTSGPTACTGSAEHGARRLQDPVRRRPRAAHAAADTAGRSATGATPTATSRSRSATPRVPVKQAVISPSALSLMYPPRRRCPATRASSSSTTCCASTRPRSARCLQKGAHKVQIDFTEGAPRDQDRSQRASCCTASSTSTTSRWRASPPRSASASACTPARAATATRRTAPTSTTPSCCRPVRAEGRQLLHRAGRASATACACSRSSASTSQARSARLRRRRSSPIDPRVETPEEVRDRVLEAARLHSRRAARHHRRLRLLAVLRRHLDHARDRRSPRSARACDGTALAAAILGARRDERRRTRGRAPPRRRAAERQSILQRAPAARRAGAVRTHASDASCDAPGALGVDAPRWRWIAEPDGHVILRQPTGAGRVRRLQRQVRRADRCVALRSWQSRATTHAGAAPPFLERWSRDRVASGDAARDPGAAEASAQDGAFRAVPRARIHPLHDAVGQVLALVRRRHRRGPASAPRSVLDATRRACSSCSTTPARRSSSPSSTCRRCCRRSPTRPRS